jgi:hypothetical protein
MRRNDKTMLSNRTMIVMMVISVVSLGIISALQLSPDAKKLVLIGWVFVYFGILATLPRQEQEIERFDLRIMRYTFTPTPPVEELSDPDRVSLQADGFAWDDEARTNNPEEVL